MSTMKSSFDNFKSNWKEIVFRHKWVLLFIIVSVGLKAFEKPREAKAMPSEEVIDFSADTFIPAGYVLVPIELKNGTSMEGLIGPLGGQVTLYANRNTAKGPKSWPKVKLLRAPQNPDVYAALIPSHRLHEFMNLEGPFNAVVMNPKAKESVSAETPIQKIQSSVVEYFQEEKPAKKRSE